MIIDALLTDCTADDIRSFYAKDSVKLLVEDIRGQIRRAVNIASSPYSWMWKREPNVPLLVTVWSGIPVETPINQKSYVARIEEALIMMLKQEGVKAAFLHDGDALVLEEPRWTEEQEILLSSGCQGTRSMLRPILNLVVCVGPDNSPYAKSTAGWAYEKIESMLANRPSKIFRDLLA